jgi:uncharacterized damage-inducible protein DinB
MLIRRGVDAQPLPACLALRVNALHSPSWQIAHDGLPKTSEKHEAQWPNSVAMHLWCQAQSVYIWWYVCKSVEIRSLRTTRGLSAGCDITLICGPAQVSNLAAYKEMIVNKFFVLALLGSLLVIPAAAQQPPASTPNPLSTWLRGAYMGNRNNIVRSAEKMPEENYGLRPGPQEEVRTFGQQLGHIADYNYLWCSQAKGEKNPNAGTNLEKLNTKAEFMKALNDAFAYCDGVYSSLTDASGMEVVDITQESGRQTRNLRMALLILNYGHNNEIYGNMVTYMRMKSIVPTSSEPRPPQPQQQQQR